jgi:hypothetical protein
VDFVQEKFMGAGPQDNESAVEQAKDEQVRAATYVHVMIPLLTIIDLRLHSGTVQVHHRL